MQFLNLNVFYMMLIPLILLIILVLTSKQNIQKYFSKEVLDKLKVGSGVLGKSTRNGLYFISLILFIIALARPVIDQKEQNIKQELIPIVIALDVSKSMLAKDIYPNRISLAKEKLKKIIEYSKNSTIGIILFAKDSFILSPVTEDFVSLKYIVNNLDTNINFLNGSNIFATLETTSYMLEEFKVKNLIILSDGGNKNEYKNEIEFAKQNNISVYTIAMATKNGSAIPQKDGFMTNKNGDIVTVKLNESIKELSLKTKGGYIDFTLDNSDVNAIINRINTQSKKEQLITQKVKTYTELFYYPLGLGLFVLFLSLSSLPSKRSKNIIPIFLVPFIFISPELNAKDILDGFEFKNIQKAKKLYENKKYKQASDEYRKISATPQSYYNLGNSLYKEGKYNEAIHTYSKIVTQDKDLEASKLHNIGNSYVKQNKLQKAKEFYEKSLKLKNDKQTKENLEAVKKELEKKKQNQDQQNKQNQNKQKQNQKDQNQKNDKQNKDSMDKDQDQKEQNKKSDKKEQKDKNNKEQSNKEQNNSKKDEKSFSKAKQKNIKEQEISDLEEKKWIKMLEKQNTPIFLRKGNTNKTRSDENEPW